MLLGVPLSMVLIGGTQMMVNQGMQSPYLSTFSLLQEVNEENTDISNDFWSIVKNVIVMLSFILWSDLLHLPQLLPGISSRNSICTFS